jgi:uncharacterized membrane protein YfhO
MNWATYRYQSDLPGELRTSDSYLSGWEVDVDGQPATLVDLGGFRTLEVPAGEHEVRFRYRPRSVHLGGLISSLALILWLVIFARSPKSDQDVADNFAVDVG